MPALAAVDSRVQIRPASASDQAEGSGASCTLGDVTPADVCEGRQVMYVGLARGCNRGCDRDCAGSPETTHQSMPTLAGTVAIVTW
jgi:hypothetical protein